MNISVFDIEAKGWTEFKILGFFDGEKYLEFYSVPAFLDYVLVKKYRGYRIYAHYAGRYDFLFLLEDLFERDDFEVRLIEGGNRIIQLIVRKGGHTWYFCDSWCVLQGKLKDLAEAFEVRHKKKDFDHGKGDYLSKEGREYLRSDCFSLYEVLEKYMDFGKNNGKLKMTVASQALDIFKRDFLKDKLFRLSEDKEEFIRSCYFGGRTEIFKMYGQYLYYYDVNSMYPFVMTNFFPVGRADFVRSYKPGKIGFYKIKVNDFNKYDIPYLPLVVENKLLFPNGSFDCFVSNIEIEQLIKDRVNFKIIKGLVFEKKKRIFNKYVKYYYDIKKRAKKGTALSITAKAFLNHLYGKFGQQRVKEEIIKVNDFKTILKEKLKPYFEELGLYKKEIVSESSFILPYLSAYVTSLARMKLWKLIQECGEDNVYYCDTDSIITSKKLKIGNELGELKQEYKIIEAVFIQPKVYGLIVDDNGKDKYIIRMKGFNFSNPENKKEIDIENKKGFDLLKTALFSKDIKKVKYSLFRMIGWKESLHKYNRVIPKRISVEKVLKEVYNKREIKDDLSTKAINIKGN